MIMFTWQNKKCTNRTVALLAIEVTLFRCMFLTQCIFGVPFLFYWHYFVFFSIVQEMFSSTCFADLYRIAGSTVVGQIYHKVYTVRDPGRQMETSGQWSQTIKGRKPIKSKFVIKTKYSYFKCVLTTLYACNYSGNSWLCIVFLHEFSLEYLLRLSPSPLRCWKL